jgi:hypothetical protein
MFIFGVTVVLYLTCSFKYLQHGTMMELIIGKSSSSQQRTTNMACWKKAHLQHSSQNTEKNIYGRFGHWWKRN